MIKGGIVGGYYQSKGFAVWWGAGQTENSLKAHSLKLRQSL